MFPFLFFLAFFFSFCRNCRDFNPLLVTDFSQAGYFSLACPSLSFGNLKKSRLLFRAVRGSIGVKNRPPGNRSGYNLVTEAKPSPGRGWTGRCPGRVWGGLRYRPCSAPLPALRAAPSPRGRLRVKPSPGRGWTGHSPGRVWGGSRCRVCPAPLPALRGHLPPREG